MISGTFQVGGFDLTVREVHASDDDAVIDLHRLVFGPEVDRAWFAWKYGPSTGQGQAVGVWHDDSLIAFCGGLPRVMWHQGTQCKGLQIGDVMVHPKWRGILSRRGPFFQVSKAFYDSRLGTVATHDFQLGYGFPNERHLRLAMVLGLLQDAGEVEALHWSKDVAPPASLPLLWHWQELDSSSPLLMQATNSAWHAMRAEGADLTLGERDAAYLQWRYVHRPPTPGTESAMSRYRFFGLRRKWSTRYAGVAVMDLRSRCAHWLDWIGPPRLLVLALKACRIQADLAGADEVTTWASAEVAAQLAHSGISQREICAKFAIPSASDLAPSAIGKLRCWLMSGDTDFL